MPGKLYSLKAEIATSDFEKIKAALIDSVGVDGVLETGWGFIVRTTLEGESAEDLNRNFLSALRRISKKTTLRSEWVHNGVTERFFDYISKGTKRS